MTRTSTSTLASPLFNLSPLSARRLLIGKQTLDRVSSMSTLRVCDACSVRRVKCDGQAPCARCLASRLDCRRLRSKKKPGPKSVRAKTMRRLARIEIRRNESFPGDPDVDEEHTRLPSPAAAQSGTHGSSSSVADVFEPSYDMGHNVNAGAFLLDPQPSDHSHSIPLDEMDCYLEMYRGKMYSIWPVIDLVPLKERLRHVPMNDKAYILASSICTATVLQLQLDVDGSGMPSPQLCIDEIERLRSTALYRRNPTLDDLLASFFLHIAYLHLDQQTVSTLLLREAIGILHLLNLHQPSHYEDLSHEETQSHLRIVWLLFITERWVNQAGRHAGLVIVLPPKSLLTTFRAHAIQYDVPCTLAMSPTLPPLKQDNSSANPSAFICLCNMFASFDSANTAMNATVDKILTAYNQLTTLSTSTRHANSVQQADLLVTRQWMRLLLWKRAVPRLAMTTNRSENLDSLVLPVHVTRDLLSGLTLLSKDALEAHGPGMELKLFTMATSLADVVTCLPPHDILVSELHAIDSLLQIAELLQSFRGGTEAVRSVLRERFVEIGLDHMPIRCITEASPASDESEYAETTSPDARTTEDSLQDGWG